MDLALEEVKVFQVREDRQVSVDQALMVVVDLARVDLGDQARIILAPVVTADIAEVIKNTDTKMYKD